MNYCQGKSILAKDGAATCYIPWYFAWNGKSVYAFFCFMHFIHIDILDRTGNLFAIQKIRMAVILGGQGAVSP